MPSLISLVFFIFSYVPVLYANEEANVRQSRPASQVADITRSGFLDHLKKGDYDRAIFIINQELNPNSTAFEMQSLLQSRIHQAWSFISVDELKVLLNRGAWRKQEWMLKLHKQAFEDYKSALERDPQSEPFDTLYRKAQRALDKALQKPNKFFSLCARAFK